MHWFQQPIDEGVFLGTITLPHFQTGPVHSRVPLVSEKALWACTLEEDAHWMKWVWADTDLSTRAAAEIRGGPKGCDKGTRGACYNCQPTETLNRGDAFKWAQVTAGWSAWGGFLKEAGLQLSLERSDTISHTRDFATHQDLEFSKVWMCWRQQLYIPIYCASMIESIFYFVSCNNFTLMVMAFRHLSKACSGFDTKKKKKKVVPQFKWF